MRVNSKFPRVTHYLAHNGDHIGCFIFQNKSISPMIHRYNKLWLLCLLQRDSGKYACLLYCLVRWLDQYHSHVSWRLCKHVSFSRKKQTRRLNFDIFLPYIHIIYSLVSTAVFVYTKTNHVWININSTQYSHSWWSRVPCRDVTSLQRVLQICT